MDISTTTVVDHLVSLVTDCIPGTPAQGTASASIDLHPIQHGHTPPHEHTHTHTTLAAQPDCVAEGALLTPCCNVLAAARAQSIQGWGERSPG
eukprot:5698496-Prymnesium_polylepis.1